jgi:uncharacterized membrane protein
MIVKDHGKKTKGYAQVIHKTFEVGIFFKGIDGVLEIVGGILLLAVRPEALSSLILFLTGHELSRHPHDIIAGHLARMARNLSVSTKLFGSFYLLSHGLVKVFLVLSLWRKRLWAYPTAIIFFIVFISYEVRRFSHSHSAGLAVLTVLDVLVVCLTWLEYRNVRDKKLKS